MLGILLSLVAGLLAVNAKRFSLGLEPSEGKLSCAIPRSLAGYYDGKPYVYYMYDSTDAFEPEYGTWDQVFTSSISMKSELTCLTAVMSIAYLEDPEEEAILGKSKPGAYLSLLLALPEWSIGPQVQEFVQSYLIKTALVEGWERGSVLIPYGGPFKESAAAILANKFHASLWIKHGANKQFVGNNYFASVFPYVSVPDVLNYWENAVDAVADGMRSLLESTLTKESAFDKFKLAIEIFAKSVSATFERRSMVRRTLAGMRHFSILIEIVRVLMQERKGFVQSWKEFLGGHYVSGYGGCWDAAYESFGNFAAASMHNGRLNAYGILVDANARLGNYTEQIKLVLVEFLEKHSTESLFTLSARYLQVRLYQMGEGVSGTSLCKPIEKRLNCVIQKVNEGSHVKKVWKWWQKLSRIWLSSNWIGLNGDLNNYPKVQC